jgi:DNA polymerase (family 10)
MSKVPERHSLEEVDKLVQIMKNEIGSEKFEVAGSYRRRCQNVGDMDVVVLEKYVECIRDWLKLRASELQIRKYDKAIIGGWVNGIRIELYVCNESSWSGTLQFATGSASHNVRLRAKAKMMGLKLSDKGLFDRQTGEQIAGKTEMEIYEKLGEKYPAPSERSEAC